VLGCGLDSGFYSLCGVVRFVAMHTPSARVQGLVRSGSLLAVTLLFGVLWGIAGADKIRSGIPSWFGEKFGKTFLATFPGLSVTFWMLTLGELLGFGLAVGSLLRLEFLGKRSPDWLLLMLVWSLFLFVQLGLGQWLTSEYNGAFMIFTYFCGTLVALRQVAKP
jgi:hypothetical protein